ncbi:flagellar basal-body rod modification protein FlgD [Deferribacter desulfuricans SSM1]|uniref:Basal-body rod modification protein FlgD n=1 Tax=Deferribacter desulfuricans (strain DSM 14783 / JCM 11476 / NBRC 101012 / SSM1) TaxID=639282 RepID=D3P8Y6_DEFDS|nr:flagellar hook assembly protein FlgD [Deferribacter desulfuricans]BAI81176.1 flagellar basal-body rod modification protein FlgD [Deferribacter desulfuricans SSM1]
MIQQSSNINTVTSISNINNREPKKELDKDDFLNLLVTQLKNQDPLNPLDNSEFIAQTTQFSSLEQLINISEKFDKLIDNEESSNLNLFSAVSFIDKTINFYGNDFSADENGALLRFDISGTPATTNIEIYNDKGAKVKTVSVKGVDGSNTFSWDLTDDNGIKLNPGNYSYKVVAKDKDGNELPVRLSSSGRVIGVLKEGNSTVFDLGFTKVKPDEIISVYN